ncbi:MAG: ABC transporter substrate-binding protein [Bacillota bacterium]|nr:ABC transporter substrate-binding protein [Bacillota bacterium]
MSKLFQKTTVLLAVVVLMFAFVLGGCGTVKQEEANGPDSGQQETPAEPVVVRMEGGDWGFPQPYTRYSRGPGNARVNYIFDKLIEQDEKGFIPWLAEKWDVLEDGTKYIFHLKQGVIWHDGVPFTGNDVVFTFGYTKEYPSVGSPDVFLDDTYMLEVKALSDYQVQFTLAEADANFFEILSSVYILPQHIWAEIDRPDEFTSSEAVIGTGPFILTDYNKEHGTYRYEAFGDFWGPKPAVDVMEFIPVSDSVLALEKGDIHIADIPVDVLPRFKNDPNYTVMEKPGFWGYRLRFNMEKVPEFKTREERQAFAYAIDRQDLVDKTARGAAIAGSLGVLPPDHRWFNPDLPKYERDVEKAKTLLAQAGLVNKKLQYELLVGEGREVRIGELIKEQLSDIGIDIKVVSTDMKTRDGRIAQGNYQLVLVGLGGWARDPNYLGVRFTGGDRGSWADGTPGYFNAEVEELAESLRTEQDEDTRKELTMKLQQVLAEDVPEISLYLTTGQVVFRNDVYDGWMHVFDHHETTHNILSFLKR